MHERPFQGERKEKTLRERIADGELIWLKNMLRPGLSSLEADRFYFAEIRALRDHLGEDLVEISTAFDEEEKRVKPMPDYVGVYLTPQAYEKLASEADQSTD